MTDAHELRETLAVEVNVPAHADRVSTPLFERTRGLLLAERGRCYVCDGTPAAAGPLEAHHYPIERCLAEMIDWSPGSLVRRDFPHFDWAAFDAHTPLDPYLFVDDMRVNGLLLCKAHHTGKDEGIHAMPHPLWIAQRYGRDGYKFSDVEIIHHERTAA